MDKNELKSFLKDNPKYIENVLEEIGCHHIKTIADKRVQSALPDGDNSTSIQIKLNDTLSTTVYTRNEFKQYEIQDIFSLVQYIKEYTLGESIQYICKICGLRYTKNTKQHNHSNSYQFIKAFKKSIDKENRFNNYEDDANILDESFKFRFIRETCKLFYDDNIDESTQDKFYVSYDILDNRVVFPIRNDEGNILTFKGRTCDEDYKIKGIPKYLSYYPYRAEYYLFGIYENWFEIMTAKELIVVEAEKSVMQLDSMEINNCVAISKKSISPMQINKLLKLGKDIVLCFDKDVQLNEIYIECRKFRELCNVYYVYDYDDLLIGKQSPSDCGYEIFNKLINEYKFKYNGE